MPPVTTLPLNGSRLAIFSDQCGNARVERGDGGRFPFGFRDVRAKHVGTPKGRILGRDATPQIPGGRRALVELCGRKMVAGVGIFGERADGDEDEIVGTEIDAPFPAPLAPMNARRLLAFGFYVEIDVGDLDPVAEFHPAFDEPFVQRQDQGFILVVAGEFDRRKIRHPADMVDEAVQVELHLQRGMPVLEGEHGAPVEPEIAGEKFLRENVVDALVLHALAAGEEELGDFALGAAAQGEKAVGLRVLPPVNGGALQRKIGIVLVQPVKFVEHAGALDLQRGNRAIQIPEALETVLHLAAAANDETLFGDMGAVERAAGEVQLFEDGDFVAGHVGVADEEGRAGQRRQSRTDEPGGLVLHALGLARSRKSLVIAAAVSHAYLRFRARRVRHSRRRVHDRRHCVKCSGRAR